MADWAIRSADDGDFASVLRGCAKRGAVRLTAIVADDDPVAMRFWEAAGYLPQRNRTRFVSS